MSNNSATVPLGMKSLSCLSIAAFVVVAACGGAQTNTNTNPNPPPAQDAAAPVASNAATADAGAPEQKPNIESQRDPFVQACMRRMPAQAYCSCAFDQFKDVFKDADLTQKPTDAQMESLKQKTIGNCASKLTEADVKPSFASACVGDNTKKQAFCDCEWTALRAKLDLADFVSDFEGPKFDEAKKNVATTCKGKLPEEVAKGEFMTGCNKGSGADHQKACECMWKKLRTKSSVEAIAAGAVDIKKAGLETCKTAQ
jgi:hypothetical protein